MPRPSTPPNLEEVRRARETITELKPKWDTAWEIVRKADEFYASAYSSTSEREKKDKPPRVLKVPLGEKTRSYKEWATELLTKSEWRSADSTMPHTFFTSKAAWPVTIGAVRAFIKQARTDGFFANDPDRFGYVKLSPIAHVAHNH